MSQTIDPDYSLTGTYYNARMFPDAGGKLVEETDRYQQALLYQRMAKDCFAEARRGRT